MSSEKKNNSYNEESNNKFSLKNKVSPSNKRSSNKKATFINKGSLGLNIGEANAVKKASPSRYNSPM